MYTANRTNFQNGEHVFRRSILINALKVSQSDLPCTRTNMTKYLTFFRCPQTNLPQRGCERLKIRWYPAVQRSELSGAVQLDRQTVASAAASVATQQYNTDPPYAAYGTEVSSVH
jgi:hypothetical protein